MVDIGISGFDSAEQVGRGESARVYKAREIELDRTVAIKVLSTVVDDDALRRFERERKAMGRLSDHDGIVTIYSTGTTESGSPYIVMPYFAQGSLQDVVDQGALNWDQAITLISQAGTAMGWAHESGVVHRDLKPSNMLMSDDGTPKISDFGISRLMDDAAASRSTSLTFTPAFSPPEAFSNSKPNLASDVYGLGATLWALLAGHPPFTDPETSGTDLLQLMGRVANEQIEQPAGTPDQVFSVIKKSMEKDSADRHQDASEFVAALAMARDSVAAGVPMPLSGAATATTLSMAATESASASTPVSGLTAGNGPAPSNKNRGRVFAMAVAIVALFASGAFALSQRGGDSDELAAIVTIPEGDANTLVTARPQYREDGSVIEEGDEDFVPVELVLEETTGVTVMGNAVSRSGGPASSAGANNTPDPAGPAVTLETLPSTTRSTTSTTRSTTSTTAAKTAPAPAISSLRVGSVTDTSASVTFSTNTCVSAKYSYSGGSHASNAGTCYKSHQAKLGIWNAALTPGKAYTVTVTVTDEAGRTATKSISFTTTAQPVLVAKLAISGLSVGSVTATSATVSFTTNLCATGSYSYAGGSHSSNAGTCYKSHQAKLGIWNAALTPGTGYKVTVTSTTADGQKVSKTITFTTDANAKPATLAISGLNVNSVTSTSATVSYSTNLCSTGSYSYSGGSHSSGAGTCYQSHQAKLGIWNAALTPGQLYKVTVTSTTADGQKVSKTISFTTNP